MFDVNWNTWYWSADGDNYAAHADILTIVGGYWCLR